MSFYTAQTTLNRQRLYRVTNRILNHNSLHFILLSLLFLPLTFSASAAAKFYLSIPSPFSSGFNVTTAFDPFNLFLIKTIAFSSPNLLTVKSLITFLAFTCLIILPTIAGIALITYTTNQAINHQPLTFSDTLKSLKHSYIPLLHTLTSGSIILIIIFLAFTLSSIAVTETILLLDFDLFFIPIFINIIVSYALAVTILFFITIWGSASAITVLESTSGLETLRKSASQSTEFRRHSFSIVFVTGFGIGTALGCSTLGQNFGLAGNWILVVQTGAICLQSSLMILVYVVANTVLYVQSKEESGEEIAMRTVEAGEVSGEYVRVAVNDKECEVVHEQDEVEVNGGFNRLLYLLTMVWIVFITCGLVILIMA